MTTQPLFIIPTKDGKTPLEMLVEDYLDSCRARGLARSTVEQTYTFCLVQILLPWCRENSIREIRELSQRTLDRFTSALLRSGGRRGTSLSPDTVHTYVRTVRQFLTWAQREGEQMTAARPQLPRLSRRVLDVLSRHEIDTLEAAAETERDKLIIRLLADTGIRVGELCALKFDDLTRHQRGALMKIRGQGREGTTCPGPPGANAPTRTLHSWSSSGRRLNSPLCLQASCR